MKTRICGKCGMEFNEHPAISRRDGKEICPLCGSREAVEDAVNEGFMTQEDAKNVIETLKKDK